ncbi:MAG TPA: sensor domain-containing diguanylate cyclase [Egicoccus sp.]|nr:sensor domain-containing diguanylate cyclase [Egicoccus sp.]HSK21908.1 sensor domain-containing diguanylate cyclase [Egicoccus sp.]
MHLVDLLFAGLFLLAGVALQLAVGFTRMGHEHDRQRRWFGLWAWLLTGALVINAVVFELPAAWIPPAIGVRATLTTMAAISAIPVLATLAGRPLPRTLLRWLVVIAGVRIVLWVTTDLLFTHELDADGLPVYGPLVFATALPLMAGIAGYLVHASATWVDRRERRLVVVGTFAGLGILVASYLVSDAITGELLSGYWLAPLLVAMETVRGRRAVRARLEARSAKAHDALVTAALAESERRHRLALEAGELGTFETDQRKGVVTWSPRMEQLHGIPTGSFDGTTTAALALVHPDDRDAARAWLTAKHGPGAGPFEYRVRDADGAIRWLEASASVLEGGRVLGVVRDVTDRRMAEDRWRHEARHDALTGLPNRVVLRERLVTLTASRADGWLLVVDLDGFKEVNDRHGHVAGDQVLADLAGRLLAACPEDALLARVGGDEFAVLVPGEVDAEELAERLVATLGAPLELDGCLHHLGGSIGIARAPDHGDDPEMLLRRADAAMYLAKATGGTWRHWRDDDGPAGPQPSSVSTPSP